MKKVSIGFDLGIGSVGWSVVDLENKSIEDKGVKLFSQSNSAEDRRLKRSLRRRYKRKNHRLEKLEQLFIKNNLLEKQTTDNELLEKRINGLTKKIEEEDLQNILRFYIRFRGYNPFAGDTRENEYKDKYPKLFASEVQKKIIEEQGYYRGLKYPFLISDFEKEIKKILSTQKEFNSKISEKFIDEYLIIFNSRREFWEGPGGPREDQLTPFGRYTNQDDLNKYQENNEYNKYLYEKLIGNCKIYYGEKSVPVANYYAQKFNFLNDMINLRIDLKTFQTLNSEFKEKFKESSYSKDKYVLKISTIEEIEMIVLESKKVTYSTIFKKHLGVNLDNEVSGYRIDKKKKPEISSFEYFRKILKDLREAGFDETKIINDKKLWNSIAYLITVTPNGNKEKMLTEKMSSILSVEEIKIISKVNVIQSYHSYSEKALKVFIDNMKKYEVNSSTLEKKYPEVINSDTRQKMINLYFPNENSHKMSNILIDDLIANPQVKKSLRQAINVFNEIQKVYNRKNGFEIIYVVVESNKDILTPKRKMELEAFQLSNETTRNKAIEIYGKNEKKIEKYTLLQETNYKCSYCDDVINMENVQIEHILPLSKSADDSFFNKVSSCKQCNERKKNKTPYQYMAPSEFESFEKRVSKMKIHESKMKNLLYKGDIDKYEKKFINRNLQDTAYATKEFVNQLRLYKEAMIEFPTEQRNEKTTFEVMSMPPKITGLILKQLENSDYVKNRDNKYHHAVDASIAAFYPATKLGHLSCSIQNDPSKFFQGESVTEIIRNQFDINKKKTFGYPSEFVKQLVKTDFSNTKFNVEINKTVKGQMANADLNKVLINKDYKGKYSYLKIEYIGNIYDLDKKQLVKFEKNHLKQNAPRKLGIEERDFPTFQLIKDIYFEYKDRKWTNEKGQEVFINFFTYYCCEKHNVDPETFSNNINIYGIRPESKNGKERPVIKKLTYGVNVTRPFELKKKNVNIKSNNHIMMDSLKTYCTKVYKNIDKGGFVFLPIYTIFMDLETKEIKTENHYYQKLYQELIGDTKVEEMMDIFNNDYLIVQKKNGEEIQGFVSHYHKGKNSIVFKTNGALSKSDKEFTVKKIYGLGALNLNLY